MEEEEEVHSWDQAVIVVVKGELLWMLRSRGGGGERFV